MTSGGASVEITQNTHEHTSLGQDFGQAPGERAVLGPRFSGLLALNEVERAHDPLAACITRRGMVGHFLFKSGQEPISHARRVLNQVFAQQNLDVLQRNCTRDSVPARMFSKYVNRAACSLNSACDRDEPRLPRSADSRWTCLWP